LWPTIAEFVQGAEITKDNGYNLSLQGTFEVAMFRSFKFLRVSTPGVLLLLIVLLVAGCESREERAQKYYEHGMQFLAQRDDVKAALEFRNALQLNKNMIDAWRALGQIEERNRNWASLDEIERTIVDLVPSDVDAKIRLARLLFVKNALDDALNFVNAAIEPNSRNANALGLKAMILLKRNDGDDRKAALKTAQEALEIDPSNAEAAVALAAERLARGDTEGALIILDRESATHEKNIGIQLFRIKVLEQMKNFGEVELVFRKLVQNYPEEQGFRKALARLYLYQKRPDDAERELRALVAANPTDTKLEMDVIRLLHAVKGPAAAREEIQARIRAGGQVSAYQIALAEFDLAHGKVKDSISLLEQLGRSADSPQTSLTAKIKLAELYVGTKDFDKAQVLIAEILREESRNAGGLKLRAQIRLEQGQLDPAVADLREALNDNPRSVELMLLLAATYERMGSIELAEKQYADATKSSDFDAKVGLNYAEFLRRRGSNERAETILTALAKRSPNNIGVLATWANVRLALQNWTGAQEIADVIRRDGNDGGLADQVLAAALSGQKKYDESISVLEKAYEVNPTSAPLMNALVNELVRAHKLDKAEAIVQTALKSNSTSAELYLILGAVEVLRNEPGDALKAFQRAVELEPKNANAYIALAGFYVSAQNSDAALNVLRAGLKEQPDSFALRKGLAEILVRTGDYEAAIEENEYLLKQQPSSLVVANDLANLLSDHRTDKASIDRAYSIAKVLRNSPVASFQDTLGWIDYLRGDNKSAVSLLEEAAKKLPNVSWVRYHLGMSYIATDQLEKASEQLNKALELAIGVELVQKIRAAQEQLAVANWKREQREVPPK